MNKAIKKKWIAALRSGDYVQGKKRLRTNKDGKTSFCCLGVLCNLHAQAHPEIAAKQTSPAKYLHSDQVLPQAVQDWARLTSPVGEFLKIGEFYRSLAYHNDDGRTFAEIADAIEAQL